LDSFRPSLPLTFLTSELAFADDDETHVFLQKHQADKYIATQIMESTVGGGQRKRFLTLAERQWDAKASQAALQVAKDRLRLIDVSDLIEVILIQYAHSFSHSQIKGQI
jgi:hypothetical protein